MGGNQLADHILGYISRPDRGQDRPIEYLGRAVAAEIDTKVVPQVGEDIIEQERFAPVEVIRTPAGEKVIDFGQNLTGYAEIKIKAPRGSKIIIHHAEVLDKDGNFYRDNYRGA